MKPNLLGEMGQPKHGNSENRSLHCAQLLIRSANFYFLLQLPKESVLKLTNLFTPHDSPGRHDCAPS